MITEFAVILWAVALLNAALAWIIVRVRPRRRVHVVLVWLFALNAASALVASFLFLGPQPEPGEFAWRLQPAAYSINLLSLVPLVLLPLVFPEPRLGRKGIRWVMVAVFAFLALMITATLYEAVAGVPLAAPGGLVLHLVVIHGSGTLGALLMLGTYLRAEQGTRRAQARVLLAAFMLKIAAILGNVGPFWRLDWLARGFSPAGPPGELFSLGITVLARLSVNFAFFVVIIALVAASLRGWRGRRGRVPFGDLAFIAFFIAVGFLLRPLGLPWEFEYLLVRPLLIAFAVLQFQLVESDVRRDLGVFAAGAAGAVVAVPLVILGAGRNLAMEQDVAVVFALAGALVIAAVLFWTLAAVSFTGQSGVDGSRRHLVYRAALEAADEDASTAAVPDPDDRFLRVLREHLGISDREHALIAGGVHGHGVPAALAPGQSFLARYEVKRVLGSGGSGEVYLARDERLDRHVAIKRLRDAAPTPRVRARFEREIRSSGAIQHPNVLRVLDVEVVGHDVFLILEYAEGGNLADRLASDGVIHGGSFTRLTDDLLAGLGALHAQGLIHRDVKPSNVLFAADGRAMIADLGIARDVTAEETMGLTVDGTTPGSVRYMAPEQARGHRVTPATDVYSAAVTLYEAYAGTPWVQTKSNESRIEVQMRVASAQRFTGGLDGPPELATWFARGLDPDPHARFHTAFEMHKAFPAPAITAAFQEPVRRPSKKRRTAGPS